MTRLLTLPAFACTLALVAAGCQNKQQAGLETAPPPPAAPEADPFGTAADEPMGFEEDFATQPPEPQPEPTTAEPDVEQVTFSSTPATGGRTYTIRKNDTLWSLAQRFYGDGQKWVDIVDANPGINPKKLAVGQKITLP